MFADLFLSETEGSFYFIFVTSMLLSVWVLGINSIVGPILVALIYIIFPVAWAFGFVGALDKLCLFLYLSSAVLLLKLGTLVKIKGSFLGDFRRSHGWVKCLFIGSAVVSVFLTFYLYGIFNLHGHSKVSWTVEYRGLSYFVSSINAMLIASGFYMALKGRWVYLVFLTGVIGVYGFVLGNKSVLLSIMFILAIYYVRMKGVVSLRALLVSKEFFWLCVLFASMIYFFFGFQDALPNFFSRLLATIDGLFILKTSGMYEQYLLPDSVWFYIFDFIVSKFFGVREGVGQILANRSIYISYPPFGGPNDSAVLYILFAEGLDKVFLIFFLGLCSFVFGVLDSYFKSVRGHGLSVLVVIVLAPIYLLFPTLYQGVGTFFILLARDLVLALPVVLVLALVIEAARVEKK